jgi:hypothetical protein
MPSRLIPDFDDDIFINYAHDDNDFLDESDKGWVDALYERLKRRLKNLTGIDPEIFLDRRGMRGNGYVTDTLVIKLHRVALLVAILSPSYLTSEWCIKELSEFYKQASETGGVGLNNKSRIFKVIKTPIEEIPCPPELKELPGYEFYGEDSQGKIREFKHVPRFSNFDKFVDKSDDLAVDIKDFVKDCVGLNPSHRTVYLAETITDLKEERESVRRELRQHGYRVLPEKLLPTDGPQFREAVREDLKQSRLSVHLIGGVSGFIPAGEKRDIVYLQHALALEQHPGSDFHRVIWTSVGLKVHEATQQKFIRYLRTRPQAQEGAELLLGNTNLENLKMYILDKMRKLVSTKPALQLSEKSLEACPDVIAYGEMVCVYLICDKRDFNSGAFVPLRDYLLDVKGYNVILPLMDGKTKQVITENDRNLSECDVAIIFYGQANEAWVRQKLNDVKKHVAFGRTKPQPINTIYITGPMKNTKEFYRNTPEYQVIKNPGEFSAEALAPLLSEIQKRLPQNKSEGMAK